MEKPSWVGVFQQELKGSRWLGPAYLGQRSLGHHVASAQVSMDKGSAVKNCLACCPKGLPVAGVALRLRQDTCCYAPLGLELI